ncbi:MAG: DUF433 domain-containing protein, partial [Chloroflexi bacterium]|nr:DUF433 domain-containing protein [Chloroflexota bacterium]
YTIGETWVAVRHIAAFLQAGHTAEEIIREGLAHIPPAAIHEAIAYYYDHREEIDAELAANTPEAVQKQLVGGHAGIAGDSTGFQADGGRLV